MGEDGDELEKRKQQVHGAKGRNFCSLHRVMALCAGPEKGGFISGRLIPFPVGGHFAE